MTKSEKKMLQEHLESIEYSMRIIRAVLGQSKPEPRMTPEKRREIKYKNILKTKHNG